MNIADLQCRMLADGQEVGRPRARRWLPRSLTQFMSGWDALARQADDSGRDQHTARRWTGAQELRRWHFICLGLIYCNVTEKEYRVRNEEYVIYFALNEEGLVFIATELLQQYKLLKHSNNK